MAGPRVMRSRSEGRSGRLRGAARRPRREGFAARARRVRCPLVDLEAAEQAQAVRVGAGDILLVRTGRARRPPEVEPWTLSGAKAGLHPTTTASEPSAARRARPRTATATPPRAPPKGWRSPFRRDQRRWASTSSTTCSSRTSSGGARKRGAGSSCSSLVPCASWDGIANQSDRHLRTQPRQAGHREASRERVIAGRTGRRPSEAPASLMARRGASPPRARAARPPRPARAARPAGRTRAEGRRGSPEARGGTSTPARRCPSGSAPPAGAQEGQRLRRGLGVQVARPQRRPPPPDGQEGEVEPAPARGRPWRRRARCRPRSTRRATAHDVARAPARPPPGPAARRGRRAPPAPGAARSPPRRPPRPPRSPRRPPGDEPAGPAGATIRRREAPQRRAVEVVEVQVRDQAASTRSGTAAGATVRRRWPTRPLSTGSVTRRTPSRSITTVECPSQVRRSGRAVTRGPAARPCSIARHPARMAWTASALRDRPVGPRKGRPGA